jgi:hypothetical protein
MTLGTGSAIDPAPNFRYLPGNAGNGAATVKTGPVPD